MMQSNIISKKLLGFLLLSLALGGSCTTILPANKISSPLSLLEVQGIDSSSFELFLRGFKQEQILEVWAKKKSSLVFKKIQCYDFCTTSGILGPKRQEGDRQIPEGCYWIDRFNPNSNFHLSLGLNYPNDSDRILGNQERLGSDIFIHGGCASIRCIPITNPKIEELYTLTTTAKQLGQSKIQIHLFPSKNMSFLLKNATQQMAFWNNLLPIFNYFEHHHQLPNVWIKPNGTYAIAN